MKSIFLDNTWTIVYTLNNTCNKAGGLTIKVKPCVVGAYFQEGLTCAWYGCDANVFFFLITLIVTSIPDP